MLSKRSAERSAALEPKYACHEEAKPGQTMTPEQQVRKIRRKHAPQEETHREWPERAQSKCQANMQRREPTCCDTLHPRGGAERRA